jgi:hypothetical protein
MLIKKADDKSEDLGILRRLLDLQLTARQRSYVEREIRCIGSGVRGEKDSAYFLEFDFRESPNWAIIHDLRIEHGGFTAQIDHLLINRFLEIYVLESKNFHFGIKITPEGEFLFGNGKTYEAIESPLEQNRRHIQLLENVIKRSRMAPTRLGMTIPIKFHNYVLVAPKSRVIRPAKEHIDTSEVVKADAFVSTIKKRYDFPSPDLVIASLAKVVSTETLESLARALAFKHKKGGIDYPAKFGITLPSATASAQDPVTRSSEKRPVGESTCTKCGTAVDAKVIYYCRLKKDRFGGKVLCRTCQQEAWAGYRG